MAPVISSQAFDSFGAENAPRVIAQRVQSDRQVDSNDVQKQRCPDGYITSTDTAQQY